MIDEKFDHVDSEFRELSPLKRIERAYLIFGDKLVISSKFGPNSGALLHMAVSVVPEIPVIFILHPYIEHFSPQTLEYAGLLKRKLDLNLQPIEPVFGKVSIERITKVFNEEDENPELKIEADWLRETNKVEPLQRALINLKAEAWISGVKSSDNGNRASFRFFMSDEKYKVYRVHPIFDLTKEQILDYQREHELPTYEKYYDVFKGKSQKKECGLHNLSPTQAQSLDGSGL